MNISKLNGKKLCLLLWGKDKNGEDDVRAFSGIAQSKDNVLLLKREDGDIPIQNEWFDRIKKINDAETKSILLDSDYSISLTIGNLPEDEDPLNLLKLPIQWKENS